MWGLGKSRSKLGKWLDKQGLEQQDLVSEASVNKNTVSKVCNDGDYIPSQAVVKKILKAVRKIDPNAKMSDFWDV